jgi:diguanylate cyclase
MTLQTTRPAQQNDLLAPIGGNETAARAIAFARKYETSLTPEVYHVWYTYAARESRAVNEALDTAMNTGSPLTEGYLTSLYHEHVSPRAMTDQMVDIGDRMTSTIGDMTEAMDENMREHSVFSGSLRNARQTLLQGSSKRDVTEVIKELRRANQQHIQASQRLTMQLEKNRGQVAKLKSELIEAKRASNTDYLTGLPNRRMLDEQLDQAMFEARQRGYDLAILMGQIDNLEAVTRNWGLSAGDNVMRLFAEQIRKELRGNRFAARFAGAKFALVLPETSAQGGFLVAEAVRKRFKALDWVSKETGEEIGTLCVSFGGTVLRTGDGREELVDRADKFLARAQAQGADRTVMA